MRVHPKRIARQTAKTNKNNQAMSARHAGNSASPSTFGMRARTKAIAEQMVINMPGSRQLLGPFIGKAPMKYHWIAMSRTSPASTFFCAVRDSRLCVQPSMCNIPESVHREGQTNRQPLKVTAGRSAPFKTRSSVEGSVSIPHKSNEGPLSFASEDFPDNSGELISIVEFGT